MCAKMLFYNHLMYIIASQYNNPIILFEAWLRVLAVHIATEGQGRIYRDISSVPGLGLIVEFAHAVAYISFYSAIC